MTKKITIEVLENESILYDFGGCNTYEVLGLLRQATMVAEARLKEAVSYYHKNDAHDADNTAVGS